MDNNSWINHLKNIILLPGTVLVLVPFIAYNRENFLFSIPAWDILILPGALLLLIGLLLMISTISLFYKKGRGTLAPWNPTQKLVISGPYRYCRNPMISGVLMILTAEALILQSGNILIWATSFFIINNIYFLLKEEPDLEKRFGDDFVKYKKNVGRWLPRMHPYDGN